MKSAGVPGPGPLTAAAVILPPVAYLDPQLLAGVTDSKRLSPRARERLARLIRARAAAIGVAHTTPREIDDAGIAAAGRLTMHRALGRLGLDPDHVIVDRLSPGRQQPVRQPSDGHHPCRRHLPGRGRRFDLRQGGPRPSDAAALSRRFPAYAFDRNKGYGTARHRAALQAQGPIALHRQSFAPVRQAHAAHTLALAD